MPALNRTKGALTFPDYTDAERAADRAIHFLGVPMGVIAAQVEGPHPGRAPVPGPVRFAAPSPLSS